MIFSFLQRIVGNVNYPKDPVAAIRGAFEDTDLIFLEKGQSEVGQHWNRGGRIPGLG